jgi:vacuolar protein sorting-associated protein IST1
MLDVFVMIEGYCNLVIERVHLIEQERECPDELEEATSGIIYAASRCGDFPELQEIRAVFTSWFGKEFAARAVELRSNCRVNHKMIQKLSTRQPSLENRMKVLKEIASENSIVLQLDSSFPAEEILDVQKNENQPAVNPSASLGGLTSGHHTLQTMSEENEKDDRFSDSLKARKKYRDVADAAQAAFESAAYAAAAARAAVELSRSEPHDPDNQDSPRNQRGKFSHKQEPTETTSESESEEIYIEKQAGESKKAMPSSSSDSARFTLDAKRQADPFEKDLVFDESDSETDNEQNSKSPFHTQVPSSFQSGLKIESGPQAHAVAAGPGIQNAQRLNIEKGPFSVRTRHVRGY